MSYQSQNRSFWGRSSQPISWFSAEKLNPTQQKQKKCIYNKIYYYTKLTHKKLKPGLVASYDLRKWNGSILKEVDKSGSKRGRK